MVKQRNAAVKESESGVASVRAMTSQVRALLEEAQREASCAKRIANSKVGSIKTAEAKAAASKAYQAEFDSGYAGFQQAQAALVKVKATEHETQAKLVTAQNGLV